MCNNLDLLFSKGKVSVKDFLEIFNDYTVLISDEESLIMVKLSGDEFYDDTPDSFIELRGALGDHYSGKEQQVINTTFDVMINLKGIEPIKLNVLSGESLVGLLMLQLVEHLSKSGVVYTYFDDYNLIELDSEKMGKTLGNLRADLRK